MTEEEAAKRWPYSMKVITKGEREHRRQQKYRLNGSKRSTKWAWLKGRD